jgi:predicted anti-sigma-YlaC factor YlaD
VTSDQAAPRRQRHLLDPEDLRRSHARTQSSHASLTNVQRWVMSVLAVTTILHLAVGLVVAAVYVDRGTSARVGLSVIAAAFGVIAVATGLVIHRRSALSPWLLLGLLPGVAGLWLSLG